MDLPQAGPQATGQAAAQQDAKAVPSGVTGAARHCYIAVRCKSCLQEGRTTWLLLKYMGLNGSPPFNLVLPPARMARFEMYCETCDVNDFYTRNEAQMVSLEKGPSPEFVNQY